MTQSRSNQVRKYSPAQWQQLAFGFNGQPPGGRTPVAAASPPGSPTLTEIFNSAAKKPVLHDASKGPDYKQRIDLLRRQMSQPRHTYEMTPLGSVMRSRNVEKDRRLLHTMSALTEKMNQQQKLMQQFSKAAKQGQAKQQFNRAAKGFGR